MNRMSIAYLNQAFRFKHFESMEKLLMLALCDCVNDEGFGYPGYNKLMLKTSMAKATISKHLSTLKKAGIFIVESHGEIGKGRKVNTYKITDFWLDKEMENKLKQARKTRKVQGLDLSSKSSRVEPATKSSRVEPRKVQGLNSKSSRVEHEPSVEPSVIEPSVNAAYAFEGEKIKLNEKDFKEFKKLYPNLDLVNELKQLDVELRDLKKWWSPLHAKLNYRNKNGKRNKTKYEQREDAIKRNLERAAAIDKALESDDSEVPEQLGSSLPF